MLCTAPAEMPCPTAKMALPSEMAYLREILSATAPATTPVRTEGMRMDATMTP